MCIRDRDKRYYRCNDSIVLSQFWDSEHRLGKDFPATATWGDCDKTWTGRASSVPVHTRPRANITRPYWLT